MVLMVLTTVAFSCALWKHYAWNTPIVLGLASFGVILQFMLMVPTSVQNAVGLVVLTLVLQEYAGYSNLVY